MYPDKKVLRTKLNHLENFSKEILTIMTDNKRMGNTDDVLIIRERIDNNLNILSESPTSDLSIRSADMGQH